MMNSCKLLVFFLAISRIGVDSKSLYSRTLSSQNLEARQVDGMGSIVSGVAGSVIGSAVNPGVGSIVGGIIGPIIGNIVTSAVDNLISNMRDEQNFATGRDAPFPYDSYVVNIPNLGPYILLVPKAEGAAGQEGEDSTEIKDKPSTASEDKENSAGQSGKAASGVRVIPFKPLHFIKKPSGSTQVKLFHPPQN